MRRSVLEMYIDILTVLGDYEPVKITHLMYKTNINCSLLKEFVSTLTDRGLIEERHSVKKRKGYFITNQGKTILKYFNELKQILPIIELIGTEQNSIESTLPL
jgi:predicted transcriptional regulator